MNENRISEHYTDENVVRTIAFQVTIISIITLLTFWAWLVLLLITDFAIRAFTKQPSILMVVAKAIVKLLKLKPRLVFAAPKRFAAALGFTFTLTASALFLLKFSIPAYVVSGVLIGCAILESVFRICVGCYVFDSFVAPIMNRINDKNQNAVENDYD